MNVLEKILEEIGKEKNSYIADHAWNYFKGLEYAEEIIRSHMDDVSDKNDIDSSKSVLLMLNEDGVAEVYDDRFDITIHCESKEEQEQVEELLKNVKYGSRSMIVFQKMIISFCYHLKISHFRK